jgi:hypothetical protein
MVFLKPSNKPPPSSKVNSSSPYLPIFSFQRVNFLSSACFIDQVRNMSSKKYHLIFPTPVWIWQNCVALRLYFEMNKTSSTPWDSSWSARVKCCWASPAQQFLVPCPAELMTVSYCLTTFGTTPTDSAPTQPMIIYLQSIRRTGVKQQMSSMKFREEVIA